MTKKWPQDNATIEYSELVSPIIEMAEEVLKDPNHLKDIPYKGFPQGLITGGMCVSGETLGTAQYRKFAIQENGKSSLELMIALAFQIGMEQGKRVYIQHHSPEKSSEFLLNEIYKSFYSEHGLSEDLKEKVKSHLEYLKSRND